MELQSPVEADNANNNTNTTNTTTTVVAARPRPTKPSKLRQTCDLCSEAKVKCDKGTPRCGRCDRLAYECVYSPARRFGRPRPRSPPSQSNPRPQSNPNDVVMADEANTKDYTAPSPTARPAAAASTPTTAPHLNLSELLPECFSDDGSARASVSATASAGTSASAGVGTNASVSAGVGSAGSDDAPQSTGIRDGHPYEYDCATVAVATLSKLGLDGQSATAADVLSDQIPHASRQAARILVCPCSADMDMALLAASLANAILDVADAALRALALDDEQRTVLALSTLPNISQVVTLFTHRYSVTQQSRPPEALLLLAASLRTTLKAMAEETTNRFLDGGSNAK
jgi:hypothetical protein